MLYLLFEIIEIFTDSSHLMIYKANSVQGTMWFCSNNHEYAAYEPLF